MNGKSRSSATGERDFVQANIVDAGTHRKPSAPQADDATFRHKSDYGKVPTYLHERKMELAATYARQQVCLAPFMWIIHECLLSEVFTLQPGSYGALAADVCERLQVLNCSAIVVAHYGSVLCHSQGYRAATNECMLSLTAAMVPHDVCWCMCRLRRRRR